MLFFKLHNSFLVFLKEINLFCFMCMNYIILIKILIHYNWIYSAKIITYLGSIALSTFSHGALLFLILFFLIWCIFLIFESELYMSQILPIYMCSYIYFWQDHPSVSGAAVQSHKSLNNIFTILAFLIYYFSIELECFIL